MNKFISLFITLILLCSCLSLGACTQEPPVYDVQGNYILHPTYALNREEIHNSPIRYFATVTSDESEENITVQFYTIDTSADVLVSVPLGNIVCLTRVDTGTTPTGISYDYEGQWSYDWNGQSQEQSLFGIRYLKDKNDCISCFYENNFSDTHLDLKSTTLTLEQYVAQLQAEKE